jgi:hypothetical protein
MKAQTLAAAALAAVFAGNLPAADPTLLNLVMPDAKVLAGVNVAQAKTSPFGQYILGQISDAHGGFNVAVAQLGFDPRQDLIEVLSASNGVAPSGLVMATGTFNVSAITTAAVTGGAAQETYNGVTILEDPKATHGVAFLNGSLVVAGDVAGVKAAISRHGSGTSLPIAVANQVKALSAADDAWFLCTVPPSSLAPQGALNLGVNKSAQQNVVLQIQAVNGGVKFGANVTFTAQAQADNAQDATNLVGMMQLMANMLQLQASQNPQAAALGKALQVSASGSTVNISVSLPESQFQQILQQPKANVKHSTPAVRK